MSREELAEKLRMKRRRMILSEGDDINASISIVPSDHDTSHAYTQIPTPMAPSSSMPAILTTTEHDIDPRQGLGQENQTMHLQDHDMNDNAPLRMAEKEQQQEQEQSQTNEQPIQFQPADLSLTKEKTEIRKARSANNILPSRTANANMNMNMNMTAITSTNMNTNGASKTSMRKQPAQQPQLHQIMLVTSSAASTSCEGTSESERQEYDVVQNNSIHKTRTSRSEFLPLDVSQEMEPDHDDEDPVLHYAYNIQRPTGTKDIEVVDKLLTHVQLERSAARAKTTAVEQSF
eukprot:CAMPEP_0184706496 /NCGR_PEP_ID=MMETSP0313-20130426/36789_1 /TAXON_ID=2792 /ORGANISM="Porphyridium aerugineum, Strain SAG 1380-2" /LENGTH=289 /DNA_ID=CAMNT_0027168049 /DNA_START=1279 /DNA_END=2148 /DNA_ORIENTATION=-